jgi:hypothetical protein
VCVCVCVCVCVPLARTILLERSILLCIPVAMSNHLQSDEKRCANTLMNWLQAGNNDKRTPTMTTAMTAAMRIVRMVMRMSKMTNNKQVGCIVVSYRVDADVIDMLDGACVLQNPIKTNRNTNTTSTTKDTARLETIRHRVVAVRRQPPQHLKPQRNDTSQQHSTPTMTSSYSNNI